MVNIEVMYMQKSHINLIDSNFHWGVFSTLPLLYGIISNYFRLMGLYKASLWVHYAKILKLKSPFTRAHGIGPACPCNWIDHGTLYSLYSLI